MEGKWDGDGDGDGDGADGGTGWPQRQSGQTAHRRQTALNCKMRCQTPRSGRAGALCAEDRREKHVDVDVDA
ncbi:uncharacterized protein UV8b_03111 [Ustilaginoidea virens]|uniref:Uncharacterized protein n=1 Tax=Ustilaginoidea virens TaxID=1159556 RepID=A0A8E5HP86_USTVR|nr:uncharacterized protein UV8b_03111 [Ustilaginoidea virens]QUC18870.1 hypothetical protein UV8b_03111 [Ustilaginoidea virens]